MNLVPVFIEHDEILEMLLIVDHDCHLIWLSDILLDCVSSTVICVEDCTGILFSLLPLIAEYLAAIDPIVSDLIRNSLVKTLALIGQFEGEKSLIEILLFWPDMSNEEEMSLGVERVMENLSEFGFSMVEVVILDHIDEGSSGSTIDTSEF